MSGVIGFSITRSPFGLPSRTIRPKVPAKSTDRSIVALEPTASCFLCYCMACFIFSVLYFLHDILYFFYFLCCIFHLTSFIFYYFLNIFQKYPPACYYTSKYFADIINSILCLTEYMEVFGTCLDFYITDSRSPAVSKDRHAIIMEEKSAF